jgi:hypothetical protein
MPQKHCPLKIILANAVREVKCLYRRRLSTCPENHSQCPIYNIHRRNTIDLGGIVAAAGLNLGAPQAKAYEEPENLLVAEPYISEETKSLEARAAQAGLSPEDLRLAEQDIILAPVTVNPEDVEERRYSL